MRIEWCSCHTNNLTEISSSTSVSSPLQLSPFFSIRLSSKSRSLAPIRYGIQMQLDLRKVMLHALTLQLNQIKDKQTKGQKQNYAAFHYNKFLAKLQIRSNSLLTFTKVRKQRLLRANQAGFGSAECIYEPLGTSRKQNSGFHFCSQAWTLLPTLHLTSFDLRDSQDEEMRDCFYPVVRLMEKERKRGNFLIHCAAGVSRSAALLVAYTMQKYQGSVEECLQQLVKRKHCVRANPRFVRQLKEFCRDLGIKKGSK